jgi:hypothetical protein
MGTVCFALLTHDETHAEQMVAVRTRLQVRHSDVVSKSSESVSAVIRVERNISHPQQVNCLLVIF